MKNAIISVSLHQKTFEDRFPITPDIKEYEIADRAFQLAVLFAQTVFISQHGYKPNGDELGRLLRDIEYNYKKEG